MSPLTTLDLDRHDASSGTVLLDPRQSEKNKILKVAMTLVALVAAVAPFVNYVSLELPVLGAQDATLLDGLGVGNKSASVDTPPVVQADFLNVRKGPGVQYSSMGQVLKGTKVTAITEQDGWVKILTSQGEGWIDARYVSSPLPARDIRDLRDLMKIKDIDPKFAARFQRLPPYSPWLPAVALVLLACSLVFLPFARARSELTVLQCCVFAGAAVSAYALVFHLLLAQTFRHAVAELSATAASDLSQNGLIGSLAAVAALAFASSIKVHVGPALYILAASCALMAALSLFLIPIERRNVVLPYRDPTEPLRYLDL
jgi:hypothetical protein